MSIQDNLKKMFTNEEQTVLWKTDIWGTISVYLTCILCTWFGTSDLSVLFKLFNHRLPLLASLCPPAQHQDPMAAGHAASKAVLQGVSM